MAARSDAAGPFWADPAATRLVIGRPADLAGWRRRSHLADGRCVAWTGAVPDGVDLAVDAEIPGPVPPALARAHGTERFWERWTRAECVSKLTGVPIVTLQRRGLDAAAGSAGIGLHTLERDGVVISVGWRVT